MTDAGTLVPLITLAVLTNQSLVWLGLQKLFEHIETRRIIMYPHRRMAPHLLNAETCPDMFVLDLAADRDVVNTIRQIRESASTSKIVLLSGVEDKERLHEAFGVGVDGVVLKIQPPGVILATIEALYPVASPRASDQRNDLVWMGLKHTSHQAIDLPTPSPAWSAALTEREREIVGLVAQGLSNKDIAYRLSVSDSTVRHHLTNIFDKLGVPNRQKLLIHTRPLHSTHVSPQ